MRVLGVVKSKGLVTVSYIVDTDYATVGIREKQTERMSTVVDAGTIVTITTEAPEQEEGE